MDVLRGNFLLNAKEVAVIANEIFRDSDYVGLYFSASWCPPCQTFLPLLRDVYRRLRERNVKLEIIFVPADADSQQMMRHFAENHGPCWPCYFISLERFTLPVGPLAAAVRKKMHVYQIPTFIILNSRGRVFVKNGREDIEMYEDPVKVWFPDLESDGDKESQEES